MIKTGIKTAGFKDSRGRGVECQLPGVRIKDKGERRKVQGRGKGSGIGRSDGKKVRKKSNLLIF
jgi:hypothetical protein